MLSFVASPLRADTKAIVKANQAVARDFCRRLYHTTGEIGVAPHLYCPQFLDDDIETERTAGIVYGQAVLTRCCEKMYVLGEVISEGMQGEIEIAQMMEIPIIRVTDVNRFFTTKNESDREGK